MSRLREQPSATVEQVRGIFEDQGVVDPIVTQVGESTIRVQTPAQFAEFMRTENARWGDLIRKLNIKLD